MSGSKFEVVVVSSARSGSNQLVDYINQSDSICCFGEIFKKTFPNEKAWAKLLPHFSDEATARMLHRDNLIEYWKQLSASVYRKGHMPGAKLFYRHRTTDRFWDQILNGDTKVIHLWRDSVLASYISFVRAKQSGIWALRVGTSHPVDSNLLHFEVAEYLQYREAVARGFRRVCSNLRGSDNYLEMEYGMIGDVEVVGSQLSRFLGVPIEPIQTLHKQNSGTLLAGFQNPEDARGFLEDSLSELAKGLSQKPSI